MSTNDQLRFETWAASQGEIDGGPYDVTRSIGRSYRSQRTCDAWDGFRAALAASASPSPPTLFQGDWFEDTRPLHEVVAQNARVRAASPSPQAEQPSAPVEAVAWIHPAALDSMRAGQDGAVYLHVESTKEPGELPLYTADAIASFKAALREKVANLDRQRLVAAVANIRAALAVAAPSVLPAGEGLTDMDRVDIEEALPKVGEDEHLFVTIRGDTLRRLYALAATTARPVSERAEGGEWPFVEGRQYCNGAGYCIKRTVIGTPGTK